MSLRSKLWVAVAGSFIVITSGARADAIDDYVNQEIAKQRVPGAAIGIMHHGVLVRAAGYGYANIEHRVPVHPDTIFQSGSIGKQFTAVAVMLMVEDGKVQLAYALLGLMIRKVSGEFYGDVLAKRVVRPTANADRRRDQRSRHRAESRGGL